MSSLSHRADPFLPAGFTNPWSLRVFGLTLAAAEGGVFTLKEFQQALITQIQAYEAGGDCIDSDEVYYTRWTEALTELLRSKQVFERRPLEPAEQSVRDALAALWHNHDDDDHDHRPQPRPIYVEAAR